MNYCCFQKKSLWVAAEGFWMSGAKSPIVHPEFTLHRFCNRVICRWSCYTCSTLHGPLDVLYVDRAVCTSESILSNLLKLFIIYLSFWLCSSPGVGFHLLSYHALVHFYYFQNFSGRLTILMGYCWEWQFCFSLCINNTNAVIIFFNANFHLSILVSLFVNASL